MQVNRYDAEGLRHEMEENGRLVQFLFSGREVVAETKEDASTIRYLRGYEIISSDSESARTYYHYVNDENGSVTHVVGEDEDDSVSSSEQQTRGTSATKDQVLNRYEYDAFGNYTVCEEKVANRFGYTGQQYDQVTGQYYLRARFYNPVIGRFIQEDTYYGDGLNLYAYCRNLPVGYADPSGHASKMLCEKGLKKLEDKLKNGDITWKEKRALKDHYREAAKRDKKQKTRLPRNNGYWSGKEGNSIWYSEIDAVNKITGGEGITFVDGRPDFSKWSKGTIPFEDGVLNGTKSDFNKVYEAIKKKYNLASNEQARKILSDLRWTPHHLSNNILVPTDLHGNIPQIGSASDMRNMLGGK